MEFSTIIKDRMFTLYTAEEVIQFSFIVRNSISYLDLERCLLSRATNSSRKTCNGCRLKISRNFINTDEKCRQFFCPRRRILYTLHLDLPMGREHVLKDVPECTDYSGFSNSLSISKIEVADGLEENILNFFVDYALYNNFPKLKILKWILEVPSLCVLKPRIANKFIDCFYPDVTDSALFKNFLLQFGIIEFRNDHEQPAILEYLLYHARLHGRKDIRDDYGYSIEEIGRCIYHKLYLNIGAVLKSIDTPRFSYYDYELFLDVIKEAKPSLTPRIAEIPMKWLEQGRLNHISAIICMYIDSNFHGCTEVALEALRLIWSSIPDACITYEEMRTVFGVAFSERELGDIHAFYVTAIGEFHQHVEPRSLRHLCRTVLRKTVRKDNFWIPEGISRMGLPKPIQSYLNLEKAQTFFV